MLKFDLSHKTDEELMVDFIKSSNEMLFHELMKRHHSMAIGYIQKKVFNRPLAEEIVQDTFVKVVRNKDQFNPKLQFSSWFYSILKNCCIDAIRHSQRHQNKLTKIAENLDLFTKQESTADYDLTSVLKNVSEQDRSILVQHFVHGLTFIELAEKLELSKEALKKRAQRALKKIRESIGSSL